MELEYGAFSLQGKKSRLNEDRYRLLGNKVPTVSQSGRGQIFAVFDGIGSAPKGRDAAQAMSDSLVKFYGNKTAAGIGPEILESILIAGNAEIHGWGAIPGTRRTQGGCAGTVAWLYREELYIFHAGDTAGFLIKGNTVAPLTTDHGEGQFIANYFGRGQKFFLDSTVTAIYEGNVMVLVSDGVSKVLSSASIAESVMHWITHSSEMAARQLVELALSRESIDDITAVVVEIIELN